METDKSKTDRETALSENKLAIARLPISDISVPGQRMRDLNDEYVNDLVELMSQIGQITPITVRKTPSGYVLVVGLHRLEANKKCGCKDIDCIVMGGDDTDARLVEITENLQRRELTVLEHDEHVAELVQLLGLKRVSGQDDQKPKGGRPEGGISLAARQLSVLGDTDEARRKVIERAKKVSKSLPTLRRRLRKRGLMQIVRLFSKSPRRTIRRRSSLRCAS